MDARFINQTPHNLLKMVPSHLRSGDHTLWDYLFQKNPAGQSFVVVGEPGSGSSTTLLKHMAWSVALRRPGLPPASQSLLPVTLSLRDHAGAIPRDPPPAPAAPDRRPPGAVGRVPRRRSAGSRPAAGGRQLPGHARRAERNCRPGNAPARPRLGRKGCLASYPRNRFIISSRMRDYRGRAAPPTCWCLKSAPGRRKIAEDPPPVPAGLGVGGRASARLASLRGALDQKPELRPLAANPLLLTLLGSLAAAPGSLARAARRSLRRQCRRPRPTAAGCPWRSGGACCSGWPIT